MSNKVIKYNPTMMWFLKFIFAAIGNVPYLAQQNSPA